MTTEILEGDDALNALIGPMAVADGLVTWAITQPITADEARTVLGVAGNGRYESYTAGFDGKLVVALFHADVFNWARLAKGFPGLTAAVVHYQGVDDGLPRLRRIAGAES